MVLYYYTEDYILKITLSNKLLKKLCYSETNGCRALVNLLLNFGIIGNVIMAFICTILFFVIDYNTISISAQFILNFYTILFSIGLYISFLIYCKEIVNFFCNLFSMIYDKYVTLVSKCNVEIHWDE